MRIRLKELRTQKGFSQKRLAEAADMSLQNLQRIEYGQAESIPLKTLNRFCNVLVCQPGELFEYTPDPPSEE